MIHKARTRISTVTPYDGVVGQSTGGSLQRIRIIVGTSAGTFRVEARHRVHTFVTPVSGVIIAAGLGPLVTETAAALVPLVATLGSFVAEGTGYTLGTFVTALRSLVTDETTPRFGAFVRKHARAGAVSLVPTGGRHFSVIYLFVSSLVPYVASNITSLLLTLLAVTKINYSLVTQYVSLVALVVCRLV